MERKRILIIRLSSLGDIVMASPVIKVLRRAYPSASLVWLVEEGAKDILAGNPSLDEVLLWPKTRWKRLLKEGRMYALFKEALSFIRALRTRHFDLALDMQGLLKSGIWAYLSGAGERVGILSREASSLLMTKVIRKVQNEERISSEYLELVKTLGLEPGDFRMDVALSEEDESFALAFKNENSLSRGYAVICPFTTRPQKHWVKERWSLVSEKVMSGFGLPSVVLGGKENIEGLPARNFLLNMVGKTTIKEASAIIKHSSLLIGVDTGLTHMGIAFGVPTIALFGSTCPYTDTGRENAVVIYKKIECSPCRRKPICGGDFRCMSAITVEDVMQWASSLLFGVVQQ